MLAKDHLTAGASTLGRYQIVKHLAEGGMAEVLLARSSGLEGFERHVLLKRIRSDHVHDQKFVRMFLDEARLAASLHHHNIVQVHDVGAERGEYFFAMEYVHGQDLRKLMSEVSRRGQLMPIEHVCTVILGAAAGLHHAHEQRGSDRKPLGIVHRDVSLSNIIVGYDGSVKVADFGIAKAASTIETRSDGFKGKIEYTSPEHCSDNVVDRRSDVFALGIVLWEIATSHRLFRCETEFRTMEAIVRGEVPRPSIHRSDLPVELEQIALKALARSPADRFQTADEMRTAVERFTIASNIPTSTTALADYMKRLFGAPAEPWLTDGEADDEPEYELTVEGTQGGVARPPTASTGNAKPPRRSMRTRLAIGGAAAAIAGILALVAMTSSNEPARAAPPSAAASTPPAPASTPDPVAIPTSSPPAPSSTIATTDEVIEIEPAPAEPPKKTRKSRRKAPKPDPNNRWDRDALFLDTKKK